MTACVQIVDGCLKLADGCRAGGALYLLAVDCLTGSVQNFGMDQADALTVTGAFRIGNGGSFCYTFSSAPTSSAPGTVVTLADIDQSPGCSGCANCTTGSDAQAVIVIIRDPVPCICTSVQNALPFPNAQMSGALAGTDEWNGAMMILPGNDGVSPPGFQDFAVFDPNATASLFDYGPLPSPPLPPSCVTPAGTVTVTGLRTILGCVGTLTGGASSLMFMRQDVSNNSTVSGWGQGTFVFSTGNYTGQNFSSAVNAPVELTGAGAPISCTNSDYILMSNITVDVYPVCTLVQATNGTNSVPTSTSTVNNGAHTVTFTFSATGGALDWYAFPFGPDYRSPGNILPWTVEPYTWVRMISPTTGYGGSTLTITVDANTTGASRIYQVVVNAQQFTVTQNA